ncbi:MAG: GDP-L-fucose synthase [Saprospiraceae bacterium]|nr:GDP-L-fucose synthase [Saprospiraceae bacterium]
MKVEDNIFVAGHQGMVGASLVRRLNKEGFHNILTRSSAALDLRNQQKVDAFFAAERPDYVFLAAAKVGGIKANHVYQAEFLYDNLMIQCNVLKAAQQYGVKKLLFLGSSCIYPKYAAQPIQESSLLTGPLEESNQWYALAKISGIDLCKAYHQQYGCRFISVMPTNLYGPGDNYNLETSHVLPALLRKFHEARKYKLASVTLWGSGHPKREFMHVDDCADACLFLMENYEDTDIVNIGVGTDLSILSLAHKIKALVGYEGDIVFDASVPDGTPRKWLDVSKINGLGWKANISLSEGLASVYASCKNEDWW